MQFKYYTARSALTATILPIILSGCLIDPVESTADTPPGSLPLANGAPVISGSPPQVVRVGVEYSFTPDATDPDADVLVFSVNNQPGWTQFDPNSGRISGTPLLGTEGTYADIEIQVSDGSMSTALPAFAITVESATGPNMPPEISGTPAADVLTGMRYTFTPAASDPDGDQLTFSVENLPAWASFDASTGALSGTPQSGDEGTYANIAISVSDASSNASLPAFSITVNDGNVAPIISGTPDAQITVGQNYLFMPEAVDANGDTLTFSIQNMPAWANFDTSTGQLSGTLQAADVGTHPAITIAVTDGVLTASLPAFAITVNADNSPPNISGTPGGLAVVGQTYSFTPTAVDPDGDAISFTVQNAPAWLGIDAATGTLSGAPQAGDVGDATGIVVTASDASAGTSLPAFNINVRAANAPPSITGTPGSAATVGQLYSFVPVVSDPDGDALTYIVQNNPQWLSLNPANGTLSGTPQSGDVGTHAQILLTVNDGSLGASLPAFSIDVSAANTAPQISGTPANQIMAGGSYTFTPTATDPDGDTLTFSVQGLPAWASFNANTGTLSGNPAMADVGTYTNIRIRVTDGDLSADLAAFNIQVNAAALGSVTLTWTPPTLNTDGSQLTDLDGYRVYYGTDPNNLASSISVDNPGLSSFVVDNLVPATYYFSVKSVNASGVESGFSNMATKIVN